MHKLVTLSLHQNISNPDQSLILISKIEKDEKMALIFFQTTGDSLRITKVIDWSQNANPFKRRPESHNFGCVCNLELIRVLKSAGSIVDRLIANVF